MARHGRALRAEDRKDIRNVPNYSVAEASRWLGLVPGTLRYWIAGQRYPTQEGPKFAEAVIAPASMDPFGLSFWNLVECSVLAAIRHTHGVSFQKVRRSLRFVERRLGVSRPLIERQFATDGKRLFVEHYGRLIDTSGDGQAMLLGLLDASLARITLDSSGLAARLHPWTRLPNEPRVVTIDPTVSFGRPVLVNTGIPVETVMERFRAGDSMDHLAEDYHAPRQAIEDLVRWAAGGTAAA